GDGTFVAPRAFEVDSAGRLDREVFGPILHVVRWRADRLDAVCDEIAATGYALTLGIHSRIDDTVLHILGRLGVGNSYVNRNMIGAVVGVQPFGGAGLSGTGPKAGGELYLRRLVRLPRAARQHGFLPQTLRDRLDAWVDTLFMIDPAERRRVGDAIATLG